MVAPQPSSPIVGSEETQYPPISSLMLLIPSTDNQNIPMKRTLLPLSLSILFMLPLAGRDRKELVFAFRNYKGSRPIRMMLVGEIRSKIKVAEVFDTNSPFLGVDMRLDQVTVKVLNRQGLKIGQKLYIIDKDPYHKQYRNGLIVGEITVSSIFNNPVYGWSLTGTGILLRVREGQFVARTLETENLDRAYVLKRQGDHHRNRGDIRSAIASYQSALDADQGLPEAHASLGRVYYELALENGRELPIRALACTRMSHAMQSARDGKSMVVKLL